MIDKQVLSDLEFPELLEYIRTFARSEEASKRIRDIRPLENVEAIQNRLALVEEYISSSANQTKIPGHDVLNTREAFALLQIENSTVKASAWKDILVNLDTFRRMRIFFKREKELYPGLYAYISEVAFEEGIAPVIKEVITPEGNIHDRASEDLYRIRTELKTLQIEIEKGFAGALRHHWKQKHLADIRESVIDGMRVLAVQTAFKSRVPGSVRGTSRNANITFILPENILPLIRKKEEAEAQEKNEIQRILRQLTDDIRPYASVLETQYEYLIQLDFIRALALFALDINAVVPQTAENGHVLSLRKAYHPLLLIHHRKTGLPVVPQDVELNPENRIMVISGPNAGGKSITLKTIGLLQLMWQSGIPVPVDKDSTMSYFKTVLTDIGDHQSIENHLSTYSYRLKKMSKFLRLCRKNTLFLIDEFGTGSDPELGGAMAEVLLEELHRKGGYGVVTTHYANLKTLADHTPGIFNANMRFDKKSLKPLYTLVSGEAGSSFTFEVAAQNHIPYSLINRAKKRVSKAKVRLDKTIVKLQHERNRLEKEQRELSRKRTDAEEHVNTLNAYKKRIEKQLENFNELYTGQQKMLKYGRSVNEMLHTYFQTGNKKRLTQAFIQWVEQEKLKHFKTTAEEKTKEEKSKQKPKRKPKRKEILQKTEKQVKHLLKDFRKKQEAQKKDPPVQKPVQAGDTVRIRDSYTTGTVEKIEKGEAYILSGQVMLRVRVEKLERM